MAEVLFYHLEKSRFTEVLPGLLEKSLARGWSAVVKAGSDDAATALDEHLWTYRDESFLPHGRDSDDPLCPITIVTEGNSANGRDVLFLVAGAALDVSVCEKFTRTILMFDAEGAADAREAWKAVKATPHEATYWRQSAGGRWKKAG